VKNFGIP